MAFITEEEKSKMAAFIAEQEENWKVQENNNSLLAMRNGTEYEKQPFPGISDDDALTAVRGGYQTWLDRQFEKKRKREKW